MFPPIPVCYSTLGNPLKTTAGVRRQVKLTLLRNVFFRCSFVCGAGLWTCDQTGFHSLNQKPVINVLN